MRREASDSKEDVNGPEAGEYWVAQAKVIQSVLTKRKPFLYIKVQVSARESANGPLCKTGGCLFASFGVLVREGVQCRLDTIREHVPLGANGLPKRLQRTCAHVETMALSASRYCPDLNCRQRDARALP